MHSTKAWNWRGLDAAQITMPAAPVFACVAIQKLSPKTAARSTDSVVVSWHRSEITNHGNLISSVHGLPDEADHATLRIIGIDPFEAARVTIIVVERWFISIGFVERSQPTPERPTMRVIQQIPGQRLIVMPFF